MISSPSLLESMLGHRSERVRAVLDLWQAGAGSARHLARAELSARALSTLMGSEQGSSFLFEHDLFRPSFARRSGLREGGKPVLTFRDHALKT